MFKPPKFAPPPPPKFASLQDGIELCKKLREVLLPEGFYPSLTGGLLYKEGLRKDIDIVIYRNRQSVDESWEMDKLKDVLLSKALVEITGCHGFVTKAKWKGFTVDLFNPETSIEFTIYGSNT